MGSPPAENFSAVLKRAYEAYIYEVTGMSEIKVCNVWIIHERCLRN